MVFVKNYLVITCYVHSILNAFFTILGRIIHSTNFSWLCHPIWYLKETVCKVLHKILTTKWLGPSCFVVIFKDILTHNTMDNKVPYILKHTFLERKWHMKSICSIRFYLIFKKKKKVWLKITIYIITYLMMKMYENWQKII